jgi:hypothetical protein
MSVTTRLLDNFDFILLLVDFIEIKPWEKTLNDGIKSPSLFSITKDSYPFQVHLCDMSKENGKKSLLKIVI